MVPFPIATTPVFEAYWTFAAERLAMYERRLAGEPEPWTSDPILRSFRFTNTFRAADRVSQFLIAEVQYGDGRSQSPEEIFFRTLLFKIFNKIETWNRLERALGPLSWQSADLDAISLTLSNLIDRGERIYSAAYIMPPPRFGFIRKHENHIALIRHMMSSGLPKRVATANSLGSVYELLRVQPGLGAFLAFQYAVDLNYSTFLDFSESEFVVAGPGALDGISKCFSDTSCYSAEQIIYMVTDFQKTAFRDRSITFKGLFGRDLQPIDCQNLFCEISKYARVAFPDISGVTKRTRIKQGFTGTGAPLPKPFFPPKWKLDVPDFPTTFRGDRQLQLL